MNLFQELKRRKVLKTVGVYAAAALIIIQVADIVFPRLLLPDWTVTFVIVLVIIGFPITFFLSWNYDIKPDSKLDSEINNPEETTHPEALQTEKSNLNIYTITGGALAVIGIMFWFIFSTSSLSTADEDFIENSIAVFGFENLSEESETSRMGEILQHLIISDLSGLTHLKVISHQRLQDIQKQNREGAENYSIAQQANAKVLLSGSIMDLSGKKILVGELIDAIDGNVIKSHRIEGEDIYSMVDMLTDNIHRDLDISKHSDDNIELKAGTKTTQSLDSYEKYLEGIKHFNQLEWDIAVDRFNEAIAIDSTFMDAYFYLAISLGWAKDYTKTDQSAEEICKIILDKKLYHNEIEKQRVEGTYLYTKGEYKASLPFFEKLIEIEPENKLNWYGIGEAYYHTGQDDATIREENYPKAMSSMHRVLELDPDFQTAIYHIFDVLAYNKDWEGMIKFDLKYKMNISGKIQPRVIRAYENLGYLEKAEKYYENIEQTLINTDSTGEGLCFVNADLAYNLAAEDSLFQRAKYYAEKGIKFCPPQHRFLRESRFMFIGSIYELEGANAGKKAYYQSIDNMDIEEKFNFTYKLGRGINRSHKQSKFNLDNDDALFYLNLAIGLSKQLEAPKYFTKAIWYYIEVLNEARGIEFASEEMEEQINEHCGGDLYIDCFAPHEKSSYLGALFYSEGAYNWATRLFKFQINSIKLILAEEEISDQDDKEWSANMLSTSHYRLGMMKLKQGNFENARQDFYDAMATAPKDLPFEKIWIEPQFIKQRIGECYFNNQKYSNAIKIYRKLFNEKLKEDQDGFDNLGWEYSNLSMLALSEFLSGQIDSAKVHFAQVEKKYDGINDDIKIADKSNYYYVHWPLYQFNSANGNTNKALGYITDAYNHVSEDERDEYLQDNKRLEHLYKYYYIHEIIEAYNQNIH